MGLNISFFRTPQHKVFNYQPIYYDERKEALKEKIEQAQRREKGEYVPGESIKGSFKRVKFDVKRGRSYGSLVRIITVVALVALMVSLIYMVQLFDGFFSAQ